MKKIIGFNYKYDSDYNERIRLLESCGFDGVFIYSQYNPEIYIDQLRESCLEIEALHLSYKKFVEGKCINSRYVNVLWEDGLSTQEYIETLCAEIEFARRYEIPTVVMHITGGDNPPSMNQFALSSFMRILGICEKYDIILCLENLRRLDYLSFVFEHITSPYLKFCFDSGHANAMTHNVDDFPWDMFGNKLYCVHLNDNDGINDQHRIPFCGNIQWNSLIPKLKTFNLELNLTLEVRSSEEDRDRYSEREFLSCCFDSLRKLERIGGIAINAN